MITTITLNTAVDKTYRVNQFRMDKTNRVNEVLAVPGGKGINVAKVAHTLGSRVTASGFLGGANGQFIHQGLEQLGILSQFVWVQGNSRETISIIDEKNDTMTEFLEPGPFISEEAQSQLANKIIKLAKESRVVSFSGSIPKGMPSDVYANLIQLARKQGAITILDSSGDAFSKGCEGKPNICKPNRDELEQWLGYRPNGDQEIIDAAKRLIDTGIQMVIVSMDKDGSLAVTSQSMWHIIPPEIKVKNTVGCGDALVAGIASCLDQSSFSLEDEEMRQALRLGTAAAASNALHQAAGVVDMDEVALFVDRVRVKRLQ